MMGVAEGVIDVCEGGVGAEMIMHHHCAREPFRKVAARLADPVERMVLARGRVQPMQAACDPKAGFVEMADLGFSHPPLDGAIDAVQMRSLLARPGGQARRTDMGRADEVRKRLRRPVLRQKLLDVEIDRRRPDAFAILRRRDHPVGKLGPRHAPAMRAGVNHGLVLGHLDQPLGQVEHLQVEHLQVEHLRVEHLQVEHLARLHARLHRRQ